MMSSEIFVPGWLQQLLVVLLRFTLSCAAPVNLNNGTECSARGPASYILVFTGHWSPQTFPKQYPLFRPPAQWSKLMAVTHNEQYRLWQEGAPASDGMRSFAEQGLTVDLVKDAKEARKMRAVGSMYRTAGIPSGIGHSSTELLLTPRSPLTSPERRSPKPHPESRDLQTTSLTPSLPAPVLRFLHPPDLQIGRGWILSFSVSGIFIFLLAMSQLVIGSKGSSGAAGDLHIFIAKVWNKRRLIKTATTLRCAWHSVPLALTTAGGMSAVALLFIDPQGSKVRLRV